MWISALVTEIIGAQNWLITGDNRLHLTTQQMERRYQMADNRKQQIVFNATADRNEIHFRFRVNLGNGESYNNIQDYIQSMLYIQDCIQSCAVPLAPITGHVYEHLIVISAPHVSTASHNPVRRCPSLSVYSQKTILMGGLKDQPPPSSYVVVGGFFCFLQMSSLCKLKKKHKNKKTKSAIVSGEDLRTS